MKKYRKGDIIIYSLERRVIAHSVVWILRIKGGAPCFIIRGSESDACDYPVEPKQVLGKVVSVERGGRSIGLCSRRAKMLRITHAWLSRLKRDFFEYIGITLGGLR